MSKSLLIVICDFLLLSMLALARFDLEPEKNKPEPEPAAEVKGPDAEMVEILKQSLEEERLAREALNERLDQAQATIETRDTELASREEKIRQAQEELGRKEAEARQIDAARLALEAQLAAKQNSLAQVQERYLQAQTNLAHLKDKQAETQLSLAELERQHAVARSNAARLQEKLDTATSEARVSQQVLEALQTDLRQQVTLSSQLAERVQTLEQSRQSMESEKQQLSTQLQVAETEKRMTRQQIDTMRQEVQLAREEKARLEEHTTKLAANVSDLASSSEKLAEELIQKRPLPANAIFSEFNTNRLKAAFQATRSGVFGQTVRKEKQLETVLVSRGQSIYAVFHISDTPLSLEPFPAEWEGLVGTIGRGRQLYSITQLSFLNRDPRIVIVPVGAPQAEKLGCKIYPLAEDPARFEEAVLIGATEGYYGECQFQLDPATPHYVRMQREGFRLFSGKFSPSRGDLVLSKTGEVLGVMANKEYCVLLDDLATSRILQTGARIQAPAPLLSQMYYQLIDMPYRLQ